MPVSTSIHISYCLKCILSLKPESVLDIGCGFGLWGFLCREYLDIFDGRVQPDEWKIKINGIELFEPYIMSHQRSIYDSVQIADVRDVVKTLDNYDLIIAGDVIEHFVKEEGEELIDALYNKASKALLVNIPLGPGWDHPANHGNPGELHRSQWEMEDLLPYHPHYNIFELPCGEYGSFMCLKDGDPEVRTELFLNRAVKSSEEDEISRALKHVKRALKLNPNHKQSILYLVDLLIRDRKAQDAVNVLEKSIKNIESFHLAYLMLAKLQNALSQKVEAVRSLEVLLDMDGVPSEIRADAEKLLQTLK